MPYLSSVCTAISTIDSESMSRSSTKDFSTVTSLVSMPVTSSMISARLLMISSWLSAMVSFPSSWCGQTVVSPLECRICKAGAHDPDARCVGALGAQSGRCGQIVGGLHRQGRGAAQLAARDPDQGAGRRQLGQAGDGALAHGGGA